MLQELALKIEKANEALVNRHVEKFFASNPQYKNVPMVLLTSKEWAQLETEFNAEHGEISMKLFADANVSFKTEGVFDLWKRHFISAVRSFFKKIRAKQIEHYYFEIHKALYN